jgi:DNA-binding CsgD family transcriptional regulator/tetratricopeptide (TPR) repeat protein
MARSKGRHSVLIGREAELTLLERMLDDASAGRGGVVLVDGEAGIGKTRLIEEVLACASERGATLFTGQAQELERARPFGTIFEMFGRDRLHPDPARAPDVATQAGPELQYRVADDVCALVEGAATRGLVLVAIDDLHWADEGTIAVVRAVARRASPLPLLLMIASRPQTHSSLGGSIDALVRDGAKHLTLGPLDAHAVLALVERDVGGMPGPALMAQIRGAAGNPLYVTELVRALGEEDALEMRNGVVESRAHGVPSNLRLMLVRRMSVLPPETVEVLRFASILGPTFAARDLALISERSAASLVEPIATATKGGILEERGVRLGFRHELVRAALYLDMPESVRRALHREAGRLLSNAGALADQVAPHMALGAERGDREAAGWLRRAARDAARSSVVVAVDLLKVALDLFPEPSSDRDEIEAELLVRLVHASRSGEAEQLARDLLARQLSPEHETHAREALATALVQQNRAAEAKEQWLEVVASPGTSEVRRAMALTDVAQTCMQLLDPDGAERYAREALALGDKAHISCAANMALCLAADARGEVAAAITAGRRALALVDAAHASGESQAAAELPLGMALLDGDLLDEAEATFRAGYQRSERRGLMSQVPPYQWGLMGTLFFAGRWDDAIAEAEAGLELVEETGYRSGILIPYALLGRISLERGDLELAQAFVDAGDREVAASGPAVGIDFLLWLKSLLFEQAGELATGYTLLSAAWDLGAPLRYLLSYRSIAPDLVRMAVGSGDMDRARKVTEAVEEGAERSPTTTARAAALRCRALVERDAAMLESAIELYRTGPRPFDLANAIDDRTRLSVAPARRRRRSKPKPTFGWDSLTPTEEKVVALVCEGLTSPQIGARLFISPRTVQTHIAHIFRKVGCSTRAELAGAASRRGSDQGRATSSAGVAISS